MFVVFKMNTRNHTITYIYKLSGLYTKVKFTHTCKYEEIIHTSSSTLIEHLSIDIYKKNSYTYISKAIRGNGVNINMLKNRYF
jgi:hypothetical protein